MTVNQRPPAREGDEDPSAVPARRHGAPGRLPGTGIRAVVASEYPLITEAVGTALEAYGFTVWPMPMPPGPTMSPPEAEGDLLDVGLMMYDIAGAPRRRIVEVLARRIPLRWLLLTSTPSGPLWGAMFEAGVTAILPTSTPRDRVVGALRELATGGELTETGTRTELLRQWQSARAERDLLLARISTLTARERSVLNLLYLGESVRTISQLSGVSETTVRSQVRSLLHKLGVNSQLAAVALWAAAKEDLDE